MSSTCSSSNNGCASCASITFLIYGVESEVTQSMVGFIKDDNYFKQINDSINFSINNTEDCSLSGEQSWGGGTTTSRSSYNYDVDIYGNINIYILNEFNGQFSFGAFNPNEGGGSSQDFGNGHYSEKNNPTDCKPVNIISEGSCSSNYPGRETDCLLPGVEPGCASFPNCVSTVDGVNCSINVGSCTENCDTKTIYTQQQNIGFFESLCLRSVDKKLLILESNQKQNCKNEKCGDGKKDDCWGAIGGIYLQSKDINPTTRKIQKLKLKIATPKEPFIKQYKSVSGLIYFYTGGDGNTPCCTECGGPECFTGEILKTSSYSFGGSSFKDSLIAIDIGEINNFNENFVNKAISICATIDNVEYLD
jgi:hypothetical protein